MKKTGKEMPTFERETVTAEEMPKTTADRHPAEIENERLRRELAEERIKTEALSRRCIRLGEALDAAILAEDNRVESNMFAIINENCDNRMVVAAAENTRREKKKKELAALNKACKQNAVDLALAATIVLSATILGFSGLLHFALAALFAVVGLICLGWSLNNCVYLLGRCGK